MFARSEDAQAAAVQELEMGMRRSDLRPQLPHIVIGEMGSGVVDKNDAPLRQGGRYCFPGLASGLIRIRAVDVKKIDRRVFKAGFQLRGLDLQDGGKPGVAGIGITGGIRVAPARGAVVARWDQGKGTAVEAERADGLAQSRVGIAVDCAL